MRDLRAELAESLALKKLVLRAPLRQDKGISELPEELLHEGGRSDEVDGRKSLAEVIQRLGALKIWEGQKIKIVPNSTWTGPNVDSGVQPATA